MELKAFLQRFREWQRRPFQYTNKSAGPTTCQNCGTVFEDNFCPRCGQKAGVGRIDIQVFMSVQILLLSSILSLTLGWFNNETDIFFIPIYYIITYKQLFGYHWWGTIWRFAVCIIATAALLSLIIVILMYYEETIGLSELLNILPFFTSIGLLTVAVAFFISKRTAKKETIHD